MIIAVNQLRHVLANAAASGGRGTGGPRGGLDSMQCSSNTSWTYGWGRTDGTTHYLAAPSNAAECCSACALSNGTTFTCGAWTWHATEPLQRRCAVAKNAKWSQRGPLPSLTSGSALPPPGPAPPAPSPSPPPEPSPTPPPFPAPTPAPPCSLNGVLVNGTCVCDAPWSDENCETMTFTPVRFPNGYGSQGSVHNKTTWGGGIIHDAKGDGKYHLFASAMTNDCGLNRWSSNSRIEHAVSETPAGPYAFVDVAIPTEAHNAAPIALPDGTYAIIHIFAGTGKPNGGRNCTPNSSSSCGGGSSSTLFGVTKPPPPTAHNVHVSQSLFGPWTPLGINNTLPTSNCDNPSPFLHPNGSLFVACGRQIKGNYVHLWRSISGTIRGPWTDVATLHPDGLVPSGPPGKWEDEFVWTDKRGHWHALWHAFDLSEHARKSCVNSTVSAHTFSVDGIQWHASAKQPYTTQVVVDRGGGVNETITVSTRERPKLFFNSKGVATHLLNGVSSASQCYLGGPPSACTNCKLRFPDYTLIAELAL